MWQGDKGHCDHGTKWFERGTQMAKNGGGGPWYLAMALTLHAQIRNKQLRASLVYQDTRTTTNIAIGRTTHLANDRFELIRPALNATRIQEGMTEKTARLHHG